VAALRPGFVDGASWLTSTVSGGIGTPWESGRLGKINRCLTNRGDTPRAEALKAWAADFGASPSDRRQLPRDGEQVEPELVVAELDPAGPEAGADQ
jgi:hypothetical protein